MRNEARKGPEARATTRSGQLMESGFRHQLIDAISALPERDQLLLNLYYEEELNLREIGAILEVSQSTGLPAAQPGDQPAAGPAEGHPLGAKSSPPVRIARLSSPAEQVRNAQRSSPMNRASLAAIAGVPCAPRGGLRPDEPGAGPGHRQQRHAVRRGRRGGGLRRRRHRRETQLISSGSTASRLGFRGIEDLGGGLGAGFWLEAGVSLDTGTGVAGSTNNQARAVSPRPTPELTVAPRSACSISGASCGWAAISRPTTATAPTSILRQQRRRHDPAAGRLDRRADFAPGLEHGGLFPAAGPGRLLRRSAVLHGREPEAHAGRRRRHRLQRPRGLALGPPSGSRSRRPSPTTSRPRPTATSDRPMSAPATTSRSSRSRPATTATRSRASSPSPRPAMRSASSCRSASTRSSSPGRATAPMPSAIRRRASCPWAMSTVSRSARWPMRPTRT